MLTPEEEKFILYWEKNRDNKSKIFRQFLMGLGIGLAIGIAIIISVISNWYKRATMVANTQLNPTVLLIAILVISFFIAFFYKRYRWEMNEQQYMELLSKKKKQQKQDEAAEKQGNES